MTDYEFVAALIQECERGMQISVKDFRFIDETYPDMLSVATDVNTLLTELEKRFG